MSNSLPPCGLQHARLPCHSVLHYLPEFAWTHVHWIGDAIQPYHPLSSPSLPAFNLSQHYSHFQWVERGRAEGGVNYEWSMIWSARPPSNSSCDGVGRASRLVNTWGCWEGASSRESESSAPPPCLPLPLVSIWLLLRYTLHNKWV